MKTVIAYLKLMRWFHEVVVIIPFVGLFSIVYYHAKMINLSDQLDIVDFALLCFCVQLLIAAGCVLNDLMDYKIDKVNKPKTQILGHLISLKQGWITFFVLTIATATLSYWITINSFPNWWWIATAVFGASISYDLYFKRSPLMGNILIALITAAIPLTLQFYLADIIKILQNPKIDLLIYLYAALSFAIIVPRELSLDISDIEGDTADNCRTLPIVIGAKKAMKVVYLFLALNILGCILLTVFAPYLWITNTVLILGHLYYIYLLSKYRTRLDLIKAGRWIWFVMILGLIGYAIQSL
jgi:4-hydroxybenzoate polyprenyltransferase